MSVKYYSDSDLLSRAVRGARARTNGTHERWVAVMDTFGLGSTYAVELCRIHHVDPHEEVSGATCPACNP